MTRHFALRRCGLSRFGAQRDLKRQLGFPALPTPSAGLFGRDTSASMIRCGPARPCHCAFLLRSRSSLNIIVQALATVLFALSGRSPPCGSPSTRPAPATQRCDADRYAPAPAFTAAPPLLPCSGVRRTRLTLTDLGRCHVHDLSDRIVQAPVTISNRTFFDIKPDASRSKGIHATPKTATAARLPFSAFCHARPAGPHRVP
jgi:hypothetical protein